MIYYLVTSHMDIDNYHFLRLDAFPRKNSVYVPAFHVCLPVWSMHKDPTDLIGGLPAVWSQFVIIISVKGWQNKNQSYVTVQYVTMTKPPTRTVWCQNFIDLTSRCSSSNSWTNSGRLKSSSLWPNGSFKNKNRLGGCWNRLKNIMDTETYMKI